MPETSIPFKQLIKPGAVIQFDQNLLGRFTHAISEAMRLRHLKGERDWPEFLSEMGIKLQGFPFPNHDPKGAFHCVQGKPFIIYDNSLCLSRQEMTCAHELAHCVLKHQPDLNELERQQQEVEAEVFAYWMTHPMDSDRFQQVWEEDPDLQKIAALQAFGLATGGILYAAFHALNWITERWNKPQEK